MSLAGNYRQLKPKQDFCTLVIRVGCCISQGGFGDEGLMAFGASDVPNTLSSPKVESF